MSVPFGIITPEQKLVETLHLEKIFLLLVKLTLQFPLARSKFKVTQSR